MFSDSHENGLWNSGISKKPEVNISSTVLLSGVMFIFAMASDFP